MVLAAAVFRPFGWPEAALAVPSALLVLAVGAIPVNEAVQVADRLGPVIGFLAAVLVLARLCDDEGLFQACGAAMARSSAGRPRRLLVQVFVIASVTTAVLSLDATVVLLTPVVFATAARSRVRPMPHAYACAHLANSASLLLPVSNLTNLLAFAASGLAFTRFAALMFLPWLAAIGVEYLVHRRFFADDLRLPEQDVGSSADAAGTDHTNSAGSADSSDEVALPVFALVTVACTLAGFVLTSALGVSPAWAAFAGALVLAVRALADRRTTVPRVLRAADVPFLAFVLALGILVQAVVAGGLGSALGHLVPSGQSLPDLLGLAALAAVLANVINNLPAVLVLLPLTAPSGPGAVLAVLLGVNIGPNLSYAGSLATLLWRQIVRAQAIEVRLGEFTRLGLLTVPAGLALATTALWASLRLIGA